MFKRFALIAAFSLVALATPLAHAASKTTG
jgi:hypothetical protein